MVVLVYIGIMFQAILERKIRRNMIDEVCFGALQIASVALNFFPADKRFEGGIKIGVGGARFFEQFQLYRLNGKRCGAGFFWNFRGIRGSAKEASRR